LIYPENREFNGYCGRYARGMEGFLRPFGNLAKQAEFIRISISLRGSNLRHFAFD